MYDGQEKFSHQQHASSSLCICRKTSKTVSFRTADGEHDRVFRRQGNEDSSKKNISMVVVNVDEPRGDSVNSLLSRGGAIKLSQKQTDFTSGNVISVQH